MTGHSFVLTYSKSFAAFILRWNGVRCFIFFHGLSWGEGPLNDPTAVQIASELNLDLPDIVQQNAEDFLRGNHHPGNPSAYEGKWK